MPKIGKNVLENLTQGMYDDSRIIYREYIQNSADQIDKAIQNNSFPDEEMEIQIKIDKHNRNIIIFDNANGIPKAEVEQRLADVADSQKVQGQDKGFRGIGRLGGLGYCQKLRFVTSYAGEDIQTTMIWDSERLENIFGDPNIHDSAEKILNEIIKYEYEPCDKDKHFFKVELIGIKDTNNKLLDVEDIKQYVSEVAPLDYGQSFIFSSLIDEFISKHEDELPPLHKYNIFINEEDIYKNYPTYIYKINNGTKSKIDEITDIQLDIIHDYSGKAVAWIWYAISSFKSSIPMKGNPLRCLRLRQFNIEIGNEETLDKFFKEKRGNGYFMGEVHAILPELIPNARRDYFNENPARRNFEESLKGYFSKNLDGLYKAGSEINSSYNKLENLRDIQEDNAKKQKLGFASKNDQRQMEQKLELAEARAKDAEKTINKLKDKAATVPNSALQKMISKVIKEREKVTTIVNKPIEETKKDAKPKPKLLVDELSKLNKSERKLVSSIYDVIKANLPPEFSDILIQKIQNELKQQR